MGSNNDQRNLYKRNVTAVMKSTKQGKANSIGAGSEQFTCNFPLTPKQYFKPKLINVFMFFLPIKWIIVWLKAKLFTKTDSVMASLIMDGFYYAESPRIHDNHLYVSDVHDNCVYKINMETNQLVKKIRFNDKVSGLGFLPATDVLLVVAMTQRKILAYNEQTEMVTEYVDLTQVTHHLANDMVVDQLGNAYVGNVGFDMNKLFEMGTTTIVCVKPNTQEIVIESCDMFCPNGVVITPDGKMLLVAETLSGVITAFDRNGETGKLSNRRVWASIGATVDGICLDEEGCLWVAIPQVGGYKTSGCVIRVNSKGEILERYGFGHNGLQSHVVACVLGTKKSNGKHFLYICEAETFEDKSIAKLKECNSRIKAIEVSVGPAISATNSNYCAGYV